MAVVRVAAIGSLDLACGLSSSCSISCGKKPHPPLWQGQSQPTRRRHMSAHQGSRWHEAAPAALAGAITTNPTTPHVSTS
eukprot:9065493-Pyramimonas_sp.AAC.1